MMGGIGTVLAASAERAPWGWGLFFFVSVALIRGWPAIVDAATRAKTALGDRRLSRIEKLEARIEEQQASHEAEVGILRHQLNNVSACLDAVLLLIEAAPEKAQEHVARIRAMRAEQSKTEAAEKTGIRAARIVSAGAAAKGVGAAT